jgi:hypothetical protein
MNEVMETIYQWHGGRNVQQISNSQGTDRKTISEVRKRVIDKSR